MTSNAPFDLTSRWFLTDPGPTLDRLRDVAPVFFHEPLGAWVLTRYSDVSTALADDRLEADPGDWLVGSDDALRACLPFGGTQPAGPVQRRFDSSLTPGRVRSVRPLAESIVRDLLSSFDERSGPFDLVYELASPLPARATAALVGIPEADMTGIGAHTWDVVAFVGYAGQDGRRAARARVRLEAMVWYFEELLDRKRKQRTADLVSSLADPAAGEPVNERDLALGAMGFVMGTIATTQQLLGHVILALLTHRDAWERVCREPTLARDAIEETLRHNPPMLCVMRRVREELSFGGRSFRAGERVACMVHAANHDPAVFDSPRRFQLGRRGAPQLGFGTVSASPSEGLTRLLVEVAVAALAIRMPSLYLTGSAPRGGSLALRGLARLPVRHRPSRLRKVPLNERPSAYPPR